MLEEPEELGDLCHTKSEKPGIGTQKLRLKRKLQPKVVDLRPKTWIMEHEFIVMSPESLGAVIKDKNPDLKPQI